MALRRWTLPTCLLVIAACSHEALPGASVEDVDCGGFATAPTTVGNLETLYRTGERGETVVAGAAPYRFTFHVTNRTNQCVAVQAQPSLAGAWSAGARLVRDGDRSFHLAPFEAARPTDPRSFRDVEVEADAPPAGADGGAAWLRLDAWAAKEDVRAVGSVRLTAGAHEAAVPTAAVQFFESSPIVSDSETHALAPMSYSFGWSFDAEAPPLARDLRARLIADAPIDEAAFLIEFTDGNDAAHSDAASRASTVRPVAVVAAGFPVAERTDVVVTPGPDAAGKRLTFSLAVESLDGAVRAARGPFTVKVVP